MRTAGITTGIIYCAFLIRPAMNPIIKNAIPVRIAARKGNSVVRMALLSVTSENPQRDPPRMTSEILLIVHDFMDVRMAVPFWILAL